MSDTLRTNAEAFNIAGRGVWVYLPNGDYTKASFARQLERENAALRADAERYRYIKNSETMEVSEILQSFCVSITFDLDAAIDAAIDAARAKEAKPCQCTNGIVRSVGRDNEEIIEDCPNCSPSKETQS